MLEGDTRSGAPAVWANPSLRRLVLGAMFAGLAESALWIAVIVIAYAEGGPALAGAAVAAQLIPAGLSAPLGGLIADRWHRSRVLTLSYAALGVISAAMGLAVIAELPFAVVLALAAVAASLFAVIAPVQLSLVPGLSDRPEEAVAGNGALGFVSSASWAVGPLLAAWLLGSGPVAVFLVISLVAGVGTVLVLGLDGHRTPVDSAHNSSWVGFLDLVRTKGAGALLVVAAVVNFTAGGLEILVAGAAIDLLGLGDQGVGYLWAAVGVGGMAGSGLLLRLAGRRRLTGLIVGAAVAWGVSVAFLGWAPGLLAALVLLFVNGVAELVLLISGQTMIQRVVAPHLMSRAFGTAEGLRQGALALGSLAFGVLMVAIGIPMSAAVLGALVPIVVFLVTPMLRHVDDGVAVPWRSVQCLQKTPVFERLSVRDCETLASAAVSRNVEAGVDVIVEGDHGDACFLVVEGTLSVTKGTSQVAEVGPGGYFGEIALLRDIPRTATVTTLEPTRLLEVDRDDFLTVVGGNRVAASSVEADTDRRLGELDDLE